MVNVMPASSRTPVPRGAVVEDLRLLVEHPPDAVPAELADHGAVVPLRVLLEIVCPKSPSRAPGHTRSIARHRHSWLIRVTRSAMTGGLPTKNIRLVSPW